MKNTFKEYHQFTEEEFKQLWKNCLFVFDTNTLLNMYRYSRKTVDAYFEILNELKKKNQLWIPYQVGYEFYENRIDVIAEYENSYGSILSILNKSKKDIEEKYKDHPFLDLIEIKSEITKGLYSVEKKIKEAQKKHPHWMEKDDVLNNINHLFENNIGSNYDEEKINSIKTEGKDRYEKKIPPGFKDNKKPDDKKYGDLIIWYQIIDKARDINKPIILVSGDIKEDWWLEKDGKRLMPLPQLKKELFEKANVDFHIYTADKFLEYYLKEQNKKLDKETISEVKKIRELEESRMMSKRLEMGEMEKERNRNLRILENYSVNCLNIFNSIDELMIMVNQEKIRPGKKVDLEQIFYSLRTLRNLIVHGNKDKISYIRFLDYSEKFFLAFDELVQSQVLDSLSFFKIQDSLDEIARLKFIINIKM